MEISVIVLNYNNKELLIDCLKFLLQQTFKDFEIILTDNHSQDDSIPFVKKLFKKAIHKKKIKIICLDKNYGFAKGNNLGTRHAKGKYIAFLNNDAIVDKNWLKNMHSAVKKHEEAGIYASKILLYDNPELIDSAGDGLGIDGVGFKQGHMQSSLLFNKQKYIFGGCGAGVLYKKELWNKLAGFDEDFFAVHEDTDFSFRAQLAGYQCVFVPEAIVYHRMNTTIGKYSYNYVYWTHRNNEYTYIKNMPLILIFKYFIFHLLYNLLSLIYFTLKGQFFAFLKAKIDVFKHLPLLLNKRRFIQQSRIVKTKYIEKLMNPKCFMLRLKI